jgi:hypothetical protein
MASKAYLLKDNVSSSKEFWKVRSLVKEFIYVSFFTHQQRSPIQGIRSQSAGEGYTGESPAPYSLMAKKTIDLWEKYGIIGEYATTAVCLQQLVEDFPETVLR